MSWFSDWFSGMFDKTAIKPLIINPPIVDSDTRGIETDTLPSQASNIPSSQKNISDLSDLEVVARTIWGEARNQGLAGMTAVGCVIQNRAKIGGWFGSTPREVCLKPYQFSCWNRDDQNRAKLLSVTQSDRQYQLAIGIADSVLNGTLKDITGGCDSYQVKGTNAFWARNLKPVASIGDQEFYVTRQA